MRPVRQMIMLEHLVSQDGWHIVLKTCNSDCYTLTMRSSLFGGGGILSNSNLKSKFSGQFFILGELNHPTQT